MDEVITDQQQQMELKHYLELYVTQNKVTRASLDAFPDLEELDTLPTLEERCKATDCHACGKAPVTMSFYLKS